MLNALLTASSKSSSRGGDGADGDAGDCSGVCSFDISKLAGPLLDVRFEVEEGGMVRWC